MGIIPGRSIVGLITQTINDFYFVVTVQQVTLSNFTLVKGLVIGIASALFASALPALEAIEGKYFWQALLIAILAALLAGSHPSLRLRRMNISTAIRQE